MAEDEQPSDTWLQAQLVTLFTVNRHLNVFEIDSEVKDGVVQLKGFVDSEIEKNLAEEIARSVEGIRSVENHLALDKAKAHASRGQDTDKLSFMQKVDDMTTTAIIKSKLIANSNIHGLIVDVVTKENIVTLTGSVPSDAERQLIEKIASNTDGVKSVTNKITLSSKS